MADKKISELTNITGANLADTDEFVVVDTSASETKAITFSELLSGTVNTANVTSAGALMDSELTNITAVKALNQGVSTTDSPTFNAVTATSFSGDGSGLTGIETGELAAIAASKAVTAVDVFVYDTSKDSDGGAWRKRTQHTSWYNETLNTATRGSRREFPAVAVIVADATTLTIYDGDDPSLPMWMVFEVAATKAVWRTASSVTMLNGKLVLGHLSGYGVSRIDFLSETSVAYAAINYLTNKSLPLAQRNFGASFVAQPDGQAIVNATVNDVAMTVLPDAPIDPATGLPVPTIAVATDGGVSVITDSGAVYDSAYTGDADSISFTDDNGLLFALHSAASHSSLFLAAPDVFVSDGWASTTIGGNSGLNGFPVLGTTANDSLFSSGLSQIAQPGGLSKILWNSTENQSLLNYTTSTYNTGWMNGDIKGAFLADTDDTDLVGGTDNDRSVNANPLTVNGTITRTAVATGADLVAYSGFSASNYLEQPYNSDLDFGTGDFCVMGWVQESASSDWIVDRMEGRDGSSNNWGFMIWQITQSLRFDVYENNSNTFVTATTVMGTSDTTWYFFAAVRRSGVLEMYMQGQLEATTSGTARNISYTSTGNPPPLTIGARNDGSAPWLNGDAALIRISATAPSAEQIKKIYEDEKVLFQEGAQATLYGSSDAVTALAYDDSTELLHVGTSAGRSVFQGLRRVDNTTTAVGAAISASNNLVAEE